MSMLEHASTAVGDALARLAQTVRGRHVPFIQQLTGADCGPACLAMVLAYHGKHCGLEQVRRQAGCGRDGTNAADLLRTARQLGLVGRGIRVDLDDLSCLSVGTILHWELNHFVVFGGCEGKRVRIVDPGFGPRTLTLGEVDRSFTGIALELAPGECFRPERSARRPLLRYLRLLFDDSGAWSRILVTSVVVQLASLALPILTHVGALLPYAFLGTIVFESFFGIPGLGTYVIEAIGGQDFAIVHVMVFLGSLLYILAYLATDIAYTFVDPRVRLA